MAYRWDPWRGCHRFSEGCMHCYIHKGDERRRVDTSQIVKTDKFFAPVAVDRKGEYKWKEGLVYVCFSSDFLIEEADPWRRQCFSMIQSRPDLTFLFLTKRIQRLAQCLPEDWGDGYENVIIGCTAENQANCDSRLSVFMDLPIRHRNIILQPLLESVNIEAYLKGTELVVVGGESDANARPFDLDWARSLHDQCIRHNVSFDFRQCGTCYIKNGQRYRLNPYVLCSKALEEGLSFTAQIEP